MRALISSPPAWYSSCILNSIHNRVNKSWCLVHAYKSRSGLKSCNTPFFITSKYWHFKPSWLVYYWVYHIHPHICLLNYFVLSRTSVKGPSFLKNLTCLFNFLCYCSLALPQYPLQSVAHICPLFVCSTRKWPRPSLSLLGYSVTVTLSF